MTRKQKPGREREKPLNPQLEAVLERIREIRHFDFRNYKRATLKRRIERRMSDRHARTFSDYLKLLEKDPGEFDALISTMLIKVTSFFRDAELWDELAHKVIPQVVSEKREAEEIRVWCAGCATGEEAYSIGMLLARALGPSFVSRDVKVFGTDVDERAIAAARRAFYTREQMEGLPRDLLEEFFVPEGGGWSVRKEIRRSVVFGVNNLVSDAPISRLDLLLCRNVFIYLDANLQKRVLTRFHYALRHGGILVLGKSELMPLASRLFDTVDPSRRIYRKDGKREATVAQERFAAAMEHGPLVRTSATAEPEVDGLARFYRDLFESLRTPVIATTADGTVLLWNSAAATLWDRESDDIVGKKLPGLSLPGLSGDLLIEKTAAVREGKSEVERGSGVLTRHGDQHPVHLAVDVSALRDASREIAGLLYTVHDVTAFHELETDWRRANDELQSANEELETTNEELQSANEELQTTNEELQSTNEELEATNEELQSTNAELDSTYRELAHRTDEMNTLALMQRTIIRNLSSAVVVLDAEGRVKTWNLGAERLLGVAEADSVGQTLWTLHIPALDRPTVQRIRKALTQDGAQRLEKIPYELPNGTQGQAVISAIPIADNSTVIGSVIIFEDVSRLAALTAEVAALRSTSGDGESRA